MKPNDFEITVKYEKDVQHLSIKVNDEISVESVGDATIKDILEDIQKAIIKYYV